MSAVKAIMDIKGSVPTLEVLKALGEAGGNDAVKAIMAIKGSVPTLEVLKALGASPYTQVAKLL